MKYLSFLLAFVCLAHNLFAQDVYTIKADSVKLTGCDSAELIIENHTQNVKGFLYNTGNGRTVFKAALTKISDGIYLIGADTLKLASGAWSLKGNAGTVNRVNFIGTTDNVPLNFRVNNINAGRIDNTDSVLALGYLAADSTSKEQYSTAIGYEALRYSRFPLPVGGFSTAVGYKALRTNKGTGNTAIGAMALSKNDRSANNTAVGYGALQSDSSGTGNVAVGAGTLGDCISGASNIAIGTQALLSIRTGKNNIGIGTGIMSFGSEGSFNTLIGTGVAYNLQDGVKNVFIGDSDGYRLQHGSYNTIIGASIGALISDLPATLNNNIIIGDGRGTRRINVDSLGNFMINTTTPLAKNTFSGTGNFSDTLTATTMGDTDSSNRVATTAWVKRQGYAGVAVNGVLNSSLAVNGTIKARELRLSQSDWPDYVFDSTYKLKPLKEVEDYIRVHNHLPDVPSAADVVRDGISVGDNQTVLLKKIEELTLYSIAQEKKIEELNKKVAELDIMKQEIMELKEQMSKKLK